MFEVELKVRIDNIEELEASFREKYEFVGKFVKRDIYFGKDGVDLFRLRGVSDGESEKFVVTTKERFRVAGIEENVEREFSVDSQEEFIAFANFLGYDELIRKVKHSICFNNGDMFIELVTIEGLGDFLEIEILVSDEASKSSARDRLLAFIESLGKSSDDVVSKYYVELLRDVEVSNFSGDVVVYTDGGCLGNPGVGAWAFVALLGDKEFSKSGVSPDTTNNKMELQAVISALQFCYDNCKDSLITLYTDSKYVQNGICSWIHNWKRNGWITASKSPVKNRDYWIELDSIVSKLNVKWNWVKGHSGDKYNEMCDFLVKKEMKNFK